MSTRTNRIAGPNWCLTVRPKPWYIDVFTFGLVVLWMGWTFAAIQQHGPSLSLVGGALLFALVAVVMIYGQRVTYVNIMDRFEFRLRSPEDVFGDDDEPERDEQADEWEKFR